MAIDLITIIGPTACGKTRRAVELAKHIDAEIISGDSRQIYKSMDIGTGKDLDEYDGVSYHLIDIRPAGYKYNLHEFLYDFHIAYKDICQRKKTAILCGGTGLYIESALSGIKLPQVPENKKLREELEGKSISELKEILEQYKTLHNSTDLDSAKRAIRAIEIQEFYKHNPTEKFLSNKESAKKLPSIIIGLDIPREERRKLISKRLKLRLENGMLEEISDLLKSGISPDDLIYYGLEYKFVTLYLTNKLTFQEMHNNLEIAIHQFAKRQMTWFRGMERRGFSINWIPYNLTTEDFLNEVSKIIRDSQNN